MLDKFQKAWTEATGFIKEQASTLGDGAKERAFRLIEEWMSVFPKLEEYGLEMTSFALSVAISPALEVEMTGLHVQFDEERIDEILRECRQKPALQSVFTTIKTTYGLHRRMNRPLTDPLILKVKIRLSPEIKVYIGQPLIE